MNFDEIKNLGILIGKLESWDNEMPESIHSERLYCIIEQAHGMVNKKIEMLQCEHKAMGHEIHVLRENLKEARETPQHEIYLSADEPTEKASSFTRAQIDYICYQIGEWYLEWKNQLVNYDERTHNLGYAKEKLKEKICG